MKWLTEIRGYAQESLERLADHDPFASTPLQNPGIGVIEKQKEEEGIAELKTQKGKFRTENTK